MRIVRVGAALVAAVLLVVTMAYLSGFGSRRDVPARPTARSAVATDPRADFATRVLADTRTVWSGKLTEMGGEYPAPRLAEFTDSAAAACFSTSVITGSFYCPRDGKVYIDLGFFRQIESRFAAQADAARAYVVAHEVGHHVQALLGATEAVQKVREHSAPTVVARAQVAFELQADCYAGIWSKAAAEAQRNHGLDGGSAEAALRAVSSVGETLLQKPQGYVVADPFTHATADERLSWFKRGFASGKVADCNAFAAP
jgi:predicted metalloprotease